MLVGSRSTQTFRDINSSGSLRFRSLWVYEATQKSDESRRSPAGGWQVQEKTMSRILRRLHAEYPQAAAATDPAWAAFSGSLHQTGRVDWEVADKMRLAADTLTQEIERQAAARDRAASHLLRLRLAGLLCSLTISGFLLLRLRTTEREMQRERDFQEAMLESLQSGVVACDALGTLALFNRAAREFHGLPEEPLPPEAWAKHFSLYRADGVTPLGTDDIPLFRAFGGEVVRDAEMVIAPKNRPRRTVLASGQAIYGRDGIKIGAVVSMHDVTAQRIAENALRESEARLRYLSDAAFEGIAVSRNGTMIDANPAFLTLYGYDRREEIVGLPGSAFAAPEAVTLVTQKIADDVEDVYEARCRRRDGSTFFAEIRGRRALWDGLPARVTAVRDITEQKATEDALRQSGEALRAMLGSAPVILYAADTNGILTLSEGTGLTALGLKPGEAVGRSVFEFSAGDPVMIESTHRALAGETVSYDLRYAGLCLHVELRPQHDAGGAVIGIIGVSFDITERAQSEERFRVLFEQSSNAHVIFDDDGIIDCNPAALRLMRCTDKAHLLGIHPSALSPELQPDGRQSSEKGAEMCALARQNGRHQFEWTRRAADGAEFPVEVALTEVMLGGRPALLSVWYDLTERKAAERQISDYMVQLESQKTQLEATNRELEVLATTDGLSGLKNHRTFQDRLAAEHARAVRYHSPLSLLLLDVDKFKQFNDEFGHPAGDAVLKEVAAILKATARDTDVAARYGGEEFVLLLPQTDEAGALVIAERVRAAVAGAAWKQRPITVSIGVCTLSLDTPNPSSMIACADKALYVSKEAGRNRATHGNPSAPLDPAAPLNLSAPPARPKRTRTAKL